MYLLIEDYNDPLAKFDQVTRVTPCPFGIYKCMVGRRKLFVVNPQLFPLKSSIIGENSHRSNMSHNKISSLTGEIWGSLGNYQKPANPHSYLL